MHLLPVNLAPVADICGEQNRFSMSGVFVEFDSGHFEPTTLGWTDHTYRCVATDSKRLLMVEGVCPDSNDYPALDAIEAAPNGECRGLIPGKAWSEHFKKADRLTKRCKYKTILRHVPAVIGKDVATLGATDMESNEVCSTRQVEGRFPPYQEIIPKKPPTVVCHIDPTYMAETLMAMAKLMKDSGESYRVTMEFTPVPQTTKGGEDDEKLPKWVNRPIVLRAANTQQKITGLVMPLS